MKRVRNKKSKSRSPLEHKTAPMHDLTVEYDAQRSHTDYVAVSVEELARITDVSIRDLKKHLSLYLSAFYAKFEVSEIIIRSTVKK